MFFYCCGWSAQNQLDLSHYVMHACGAAFRTGRLLAFSPSVKRTAEESFKNRYGIDLLKKR